METITIQVKYDEQSDPENVYVSLHLNDSSYAGKEVQFELRQEFVVKDSRPVNSSRLLHKSTVRLKSGNNELTIEKKSLRAYTHSGPMLDVAISAVVTLEDRILFDTAVSKDLELRLHTRPSVKHDAKEQIDPKDAFDFIKNFRSIAAHRQMIVLGLAVVGGIVALINAALGIHDQFSPEAQTILYSHTNSDGEGQSPLLAALVGSGVVGAIIWFAIKHQLKQYMTFKIGSLPPELNRDTSINIQELVQGKSRVAIQNAVLRVVACNLECGQYIRGSGTDRRTVSFKEPFRAVVLYERKLHLRKSIPLQHQVSGDFSLAPMFNVLYPPQMHNGTHGIKVAWEVQLLHDDFIDQELSLPSSDLHYLDFLYESKEEEVKEKKRKTSFMEEIFHHA